jgi:predicted dehydrogenase
MLRDEKQVVVRVGVVGCGRIARRFVPETKYVNGVEVVGAFDHNPETAKSFIEENNLSSQYSSYTEMLEDVDAVYIATPHWSHYEYSKQALLIGKHTLCEIPLVLDETQARELYELAEKQQVILMEAHKTAHCPAFNHHMVMIKSGVIGEVVDIEASLTRLLPDKTRREFDASQAGGAMYESASYPLLPIFKLLGTDYKNLNIYSRMENGVDIYTKGVLRYPTAVCSFKLGLGVKTKAILLFPAPKGMLT